MCKCSGWKCVPNKPASCGNFPVYPTGSTNTKILTKLGSWFCFHCVCLKVTEMQINRLEKKGQCCHTCLQCLCLELSSSRELKPWVWSPVPQMNKKDAAEKLYSICLGWVHTWNLPGELLSPQWALFSDTRWALGASILFWKFWVLWIRDDISPLFQ